jgi:hypothetical protein
MKAMLKKIFERIILPLVFLLAGNNIVHASDKDSTIIKTPVNSGDPIVTVNRKPVDINVRSFEELEQYIEGGGEFNVNNNRPGYSNEEIDAFNNTADTTLQHLRSWAAHTVEETEATNNLVDYLSPSDINRLPVGFKKKIGNNTYLTIAVSSAIFKPAYAELTVFARVKLPNGQTIFFGIQKLQLSYNGGIIGEAKLVLLGDVAIPINNGNARIILKGSFSLQTGTSNGPPLTFVSIDCKGFKELGINADVEFPRSLMQPVNPSTNQVVSGSVKANFSLSVTDWNDILTTLDFTTPFQVKGLNGFVFELSNVIIDLSDIRNSTTIIFPAGYQEKYLDRNAPNAWRGVYAKRIDIKVPAAFKDKTQQPGYRVGFGVDDLVIDNNGITGIFFAENILPITKGNAGNWKFSLDSIRIALEANRLIRAGFGGRIGLPIANPKDEDSLNKRKFLEYSAVINFNGGYVCRVTTKDTLDFDIWRAKALILPNSYVQLSGNSDSLSAEAMLNGKLGIESHTMTDDGSPNASANALAKLQGIEFRSLHLTTYAPYLTAEYLGYSGEIKFGNFPLSIENIALQRLSSNNNNEVAIAFGVKLNLGDENEFSGKSRLRVIGALQTESGTHRWKFARLEIESLEIHANFKDAFTLDGFVNFFNNPSTDASRPGRGFEGALKVKFKGLRKDNSSNSIEITASAVFGKASTYRYWYVDGNVAFGTGIGAAPFRLRGFGGGAYYRMSKLNTQAAFSFGSETGVAYKADSTAGFGVKAMILFDGGTKALTGSAAFEINFYRGGGVRYIGIFGYIKLSEDILPIDDNGKKNMVKTKFQSLTNFANSLTPAQEIDLIEKLKNNPSKGAEEQTQGTSPQDEKPGDSGIAAYAGIQYDFSTKVFHANFDMYIIAAGGMLKGVGPNNRAGWVVFHIEPSKWYLRVGTPTDPVGVKIGIGSLNISTTAYFMMGSEMPAFPPPPQQVVNILAQSGLTYSSNMSSGDLAGGRGIAFGASLSASTGDIKFLFFYANFAAGIGFDVMLKDYGNATCNSNPIGINGWYAKGRAYAYLQGELGIKIKIFGFRKKIPLITAGAAALLEAKLPNPTWVGGSLGFYVNVLGGLIKGHFNFKFSFGNDCVITNGDPETEASINIIESITPDRNATEVDRFVKPELKLRLKLSDVLDVPREDGSGTDYYRARVQSFKLFKTSDNSEISAVTQINSAQDILTLIPSAVLTATAGYKLSAKLNFDKKVGNNWVPYYENGQLVEDTANYNFTTAAAPDTIAPGTLKELFPFFDQKNLYKGEPNKGVIKLNAPDHDFFIQYPQWKVRFEDMNGVVMGTTNATTFGDSLFNFSLPTSLAINTTYKLLLIGDGNGANPDKPAIKITFTTSSYNTLADKVNALHLNQPIVGRISSDVIDLQAGVDNYEGFELYELKGNVYTRNQPTVRGVAILDGDPYYNNFIKDRIYTPFPHTAVVNNTTTVIQLTDQNNLIYSVPPANAPVNAITPAWYYVNYLQSNTYSGLLKTRLPFVYDLNKYYNRHFLELRLKVINTYLGYNGVIGNGGSIPAPLQPLIIQPFPFMLSGPYKTRFTFVNLDGTTGTSGDFDYVNPIE